MELTIGWFTVVFLAGALIRLGFRDRWLDRMLLVVPTFRAPSIPRRSSAVATRRIQHVTPSWYVTSRKLRSSQQKRTKRAAITVKPPELPVLAPELVPELAKIAVEPAPIAVLVPVETMAEPETEQEELVITKGFPPKQRAIIRKMLECGFSANEIADGVRGNRAAVLALVKQLKQEMNAVVLAAITPEAPEPVQEDFPYVSPLAYL